MINPTSKNQLIDLVCREHEKLEAAIASLSEEQLSQIKVHGKETVKDILGHIIAWEQRLITWLHIAASGQIPERPERGTTWQDMARLDEQTFIENQHRPTHDMLVDFTNSFHQVVKEIEKLTEDDLLNPLKYEWTKGKPLWEVIAANTYDHYCEHTKPVYALLHE